MVEVGRSVVVGEWVTSWWWVVVVVVVNSLYGRSAVKP